MLWEGKVVDPGEIHRAGLDGLRAEGGHQGGLSHWVGCPAPPPRSRRGLLGFTLPRPSFPPGPLAALSRCSGLLASPDWGSL